MDADDEDQEDLVFDQAKLLTKRNKKTTQDGPWCYRFFKTVSLSVAFLALGLCIAIPGPTLLDLQERVHTDAISIAYIFSARSVGYLIGAIIGGFLFDRFNQKLLLGVTLFITAIATGGAPWCPSIALLAVSFSFQGVSMGILDTGGNVYCLQIWGQKSGPYLQLMHCLFGIGAFLSPFIAKPFISADTSHNATGFAANHHAGVIPDAHVPIVIPDFRATPSHLYLVNERHVRQVSHIRTTTTVTTVKPVVLKPVISSSDHLKPDMADGQKMRLHIEHMIPSKNTQPTTTSLQTYPTDNLTLAISNITRENSTLASNLTTEISQDTITTTVPVTTTVSTTGSTSTISPTSTNAKKISTKELPVDINSTMILTNDSTETTTVHYWKPKHTVDVFTNAISVFKNISRIQFAYLIIAAVCLIASMLFISIYCCDKHVSSLQTPHDPRHLRTSESFCFRVQILVLLFVFFFIYVGMEVTYGGFILTFTVEYLQWTKQDGVIMTGIYWGSIAVGRVLSIPISKFFRPTHMLIIDLILVLVASLLLSFALQHYNDIIWVATLIFGLGMSSIFPTGLQWAESYMKVTGKATTVMVAGSALGEMALPVLTGYFFAVMDKMALMYMTLASAVISIVVYVVLQNLASNRVSRYDAFSRSNDAEMVDMVNYDNEDYVVFSQDSCPRKRLVDNGYHKLAINDDDD